MNSKIRIAIIFVLSIIIAFFSCRYLKLPKLNGTEEHYNLIMREHTIAAYRWQFFSSQIIFVIVNFVVIMGLYMAWLQFKKDLNSDKQEKKDPTTLKISTKSVEISSTIIGLIILVISLGFYFMYLKYVFPIEIVK